jgi:hypothetical protein
MKMSKNAKKSVQVVGLCEKTIKAVRMAHALVKKGRHDNYRISQIIRGKVGVHVTPDTIAGVQRSHRYQIGRALSLVM